ncbi:MAG: energy-coupling factor transporter transmembrane protein EcfT, partial [Atopobium sp.]|nr:energy-coupling factor transporter transmembrane protein EcfT [Atopobium sp.]
VFGFAVLGLILCIVQTLVAPAGQVLFLCITVGGLEHGFNVALKTIALALPLLSMLSLMRVEDLMNALVEVAHVPYPYAFTIATVLRFVPVFASEMNHIMEAQMARGVEFDTKNPIKKFQLTMPLIVPLLVSSVKKADASALAAEQRGFYLRNASSAFKRYPLAPSDFALMILGVAVIVVILMYS